MSKECQVCFENFNKVSRARASCPFCAFDACRMCAKRYLLSMTNDAHCMNCKRTWSRKTMNTLFDLKFIQKEYRLHKENILFEKEVARMPETQPIVERIILNREISTEIRNIQNEIAALKLKRSSLQESQRFIHNNKVERRVFIQKCPEEKCNGFLDEQFMCGLCKTRTCKKCLEILQPDHKCDPNILENVKLFKTDTVPCPRCSVRIFKIEGCDQMFCTKCHTPFSWSTGRVESGVIHNPHYFEWLRERQREIPRQAGDVICGRQLDNQFIVDAIRRYSPAEARSLVVKLRFVIHLQNVFIPEYREMTIEDPSLRIRFLMKEIDESSFKIQIQRKNKKIEMIRENLDVLTMFVDVMTDIYYKMKEEVISKTEGEEEITKITQYANECWSDIGLQYKTLALKIDYDKMNIIRVRPSEV
jgi:hypothetical protein